MLCRTVHVSCIIYLKLKPTCTVYESFNGWHSVYGLKAACLTKGSLEWQEYQFCQMKHLGVNGGTDIAGSIKWKDNLLGRFLVWHLEVQSPFQVCWSKLPIFSVPLCPSWKKGTNNPLSPPFMGCRDNHQVLSSTERDHPWKVILEKKAMKLSLNKTLNKNQQQTENLCRETWLYFLWWNLQHEHFSNEKISQKLKHSEKLSLWHRAYVLPHRWCFQNDFYSFSTQHCKGNDPKT